MDRWKKLKEQRVIQAKVFDYYQKEFKHPDNSKQGIFDVLHCPDWVNVVAVNEKEEILLIKQFRAGTEEVTWEIPGGALDLKEAPIDGAKREFREETGWMGREWKFLARVSVNPAFMNNYCHFYLAQDLIYEGALQLDELEDIELTFVPRPEVENLLAQGLIHHSLATLGLSKYLLDYYQGKISPLA